MWKRRGACREAVGERAVGGELTAAAAVGMRPVLIRAPDEPAGAVHRVEGEESERETTPALSDV